jgi:hypothetical protein
MTDVPGDGKPDALRDGLVRRLAAETNRAEKAKLSCYVDLIDALAESRQGHEETLRLIAVGTAGDLMYPDLCLALRDTIGRVQALETELLRLVAEDRIGDVRWDEALDEVVEAVRVQGDLMQRINESDTDGDPDAPPRVLH